jgi:hypothetical protein
VAVYKPVSLVEYIQVLVAAYTQAWAALTVVLVAYRLALRNQTRY